jgi:hypothetical protein
MAEDSDYNLPAVQRYLEDFSDGFGFDLPGRDQTLGRDIVGLLLRGRAAGSAEATGSVWDVGMLARARRGRSPDGSPWPSGDDAYRAKKRQQYGWDDPNYRTGHMLSEESMRGRTTVEQHEINLVYGTGQHASRSVSPTQHMSAADRKLTDIQKAQLAYETRDFWGLSDNDEEAVFDECQDAMDNYILASD